MASRSTIAAKSSPQERRARQQRASDRAKTCLGVSKSRVRYGLPRIGLFRFCSQRPRRRHVGNSTSRISHDYIMLFHREWIQEIKWGGDRAKAVEQADDNLRLSPWKSFAAFARMIRGRSRPFTPQDRRIGEAIRQAMIEVSLRFSESRRCAEAGGSAPGAADRRAGPSRSKHTVLDPRINHPKRTIRL
jgi:hypothetical protein